MSEFQEINSLSEGVSTSTSLWNPTFVEVQPNLPDLVEVDLEDITNVGESIHIVDPDTEHSDISFTSGGNIGIQTNIGNATNDIPNYRSPLSYYLEKMYYVGICPYNPSDGSQEIHSIKNKIQKVQKI